MFPDRTAISLAEPRGFGLRPVQRDQFSETSSARPTQRDKLSRQISESKGARCRPAIGAVPQAGRCDGRCGAGCKAATQISRTAASKSPRALRGPRPRSEWQPGPGKSRGRRAVLPVRRERRPRELRSAARARRRESGTPAAHAPMERNPIRSAPDKSAYRRGRGTRCARNGWATLAWPRATAFADRVQWQRRAVLPCNTGANSGDGFGRVHRHWPQAVAGRGETISRGDCFAARLSGSLRNASLRCAMVSFSRLRSLRICPRAWSAQGPLLSSRA